MSKKRKQVDERILILENCDRGLILEVAKILLGIISEAEQYFKECEDVALIVKHPEKLTKRKIKIRGMLFELHNIFRD